MSFPSLKTATSFTWCYLLRQKALHLPQKDQKTSAYTDWTVCWIHCFSKHSLVHSLNQHFESACLIYMREMKERKKTGKERQGGSDAGTPGLGG